MAGLISQAYAQQAAIEPAAVMQTVQVSGYRNSLLSAARDKKESVGFQDSVNAEDFGKFPDRNIAESLSRIPGVGVVRDVTGEGLNIQIRGLGSSFTKILLNNAPVAVASTGPADGPTGNREVDLDMLPTDLFTKLTVSKSPNASMIEGGAAGVVNMRSARPFDKEGRYGAVNLVGTKSAIADKVGMRGSVLGSETFGSTFGILGGLTFARQQSRTTGFETIGWTNPNLSAAQNPASTRNNTGGGNWTIPASVPANAGNGLVAGTPIDQSFLLAHNPGLTIQQIDNALVPRLGRSMDMYGTRDKMTAILAAEYRPTEDLHFYIDTMYSKRDDDLKRVSYAWAVRNNAVIPLNMKVGRDDCSDGCTATSGTFANAVNFIEFSPTSNKVTLLGINPGMEWKLAPRLTLDGQLNYTSSKFVREMPTVMPITAPNSGNTVTYTNSGAIPSIVSSLDLNSPATYGWTGGRVNVQNELRETSTKGAHTNLNWGDKSFSIKLGLAYDDIYRRIRGQDNSAAWQAAVCGNNPSVFLMGPNGAPPCNGASTPGASAAALYPGYGTGATAGQSAALTYQGSLIPATALPSYLVPGPYGKQVIDWERFRADAKYDAYNGPAPSLVSATTGANTGSYVREQSTGFYTEINGEAMPLGYELRYDAGVRYVRTKQSVGAYNSLPDPRNAALTQNGSKYPTVDQWLYQDTTYNNVLPSATAALNLSKNVVARAALSRTMTRANPGALRPGIDFGQPSADVGSFGNPALTPYLSDNIDLGLDWYTGREGYLSATVFQKKLTGFTINENLTVPFSSLAAYGITYAALTPTQQTAINSRGGPNVATVVMTRPSNAEGILRIRGLELGWVQPLDKWLPVRGFGFNETATFINQLATGEGSNGFVALGVPKRTNNASAYYDNHGFMARLSHTFELGSKVSSPNQYGITNAALFLDDYRQVDFSSSVDLEKVLNKDGWPTVTFDIVNLNQNSRRTYYQFSNAAFSQYSPGRTFSLGMRAKF